ncbi:MAG TPA: hypothetical protein VGK22_03030 [Candidatus Angelobacter sp.]|jgi:hypothetical protein
MAKFCEQRCKVVPICTRPANMLATFMCSPCGQEEDRDEAKKTSKQCESFASSGPRALANSGLIAVRAAGISSRQAQGKERMNGLQGTFAANQAGFHGP